MFALVFSRRWNHWHPLEPRRLLQTQIYLDQSLSIFLTMTENKCHCIRSSINPSSSSFHEIHKWTFHPFIGRIWRAIIQQHIIFCSIFIMLIFESWKIDQCIWIFNLAILPYHTCWSIDSIVPRLSIIPTVTSMGGLCSVHLPVMYALLLNLESLLSSR